MTSVSKNAVTREWWKGAPPASAPQARAVAYYRHSAQDKQENSIPLQQEQVRAWAEGHGIEISQEFSDAGVSGLSTERREAWNDMIENWVKKRTDFEYVLVLDVSRWGRFQDIDLSAAYAAECTRHGKQVIYTTLGIPRKDDLFHPIMVSLERFRAAQYSRELSEKVFRGCSKVAQQGFCAGGTAAYGLKRMLLDGSRRPVMVLSDGQRKRLQNERVTFVPGDPDELKVVRRIFMEYARDRLAAREIARRLNDEGIPSPGGRRWTSTSVIYILKNRIYTGTIVYNKFSQRLMGPVKRNPEKDWILCPSAFPPLIPSELFDEAQSIFDEQGRRRSPKGILEKLRGIHERQGLLSISSLRISPEAPSLYSIEGRLLGIRRAYQELFLDARVAILRTVREALAKVCAKVENHEDFLVLNGSLTVLVQPSIPVPTRYEANWPFWPDPRPVVDITLGVLISAPKDFNILGYLAFPRLFFPASIIRLSSNNDPRIDLFGHRTLDFLRDLLN